MLRASQQQMLQFSKQAATIRRESGNQLRSQINQINTHMRQNSLVASQLATRNARLRQDYMFTQGAAKKAILQEMLANDVRRKQMQEHNAALSRQSNHVRATSTRNLQRQLQDIDRLKAAEMDLRHARMATIQAQRDRGISRIQRGQAIGGVGVGLTAGGVAGLAFFASAAKHAMKYRDEAAKTFTQVDEQLGASVEKLEQMGVRVARNVPIPFKQMQETLYEIFSSMEIDNLPQAERLLTAMSKAAVAGATDIKTAGDATISILNGFKLPISDVNRVLDVQFRTVKEGRITYDEFARSIGRAIPSVAAAGGTVEDLGGMMAFLTRSGLSAAMAATSTARAFDLLKNPKFLQRMEALGLQVQEGGKFKPMVQVMQELRQALSGLPTAEATKKMSEFIGLAEDPKALKALEDMGIRVKNIADPKIAAQIKNNTVKLSDLSLKAAQLRVRKGSASKEEKKAIDQQLRQISLQKAQISNASAHARAGAKVSKELRPAVEIMADLEEKLKNVTEVERAEIMAALTKGSGGTIQAMRFVNLALTDQGDLLGKLTGEVRNSGGAFKKAYDIMRDTPGAKIQDLKNKWETFRQEIGVHVIPIALKLIEKLAGIAKWLGELDDGTKKNIVKFGLIVAAIMTFLGILTILSGMLLVISGAFTMLAGGSALGAAVLGFGKFVALGLAAKQMLESTNPLIRTLGLLFATLAAKAIIASVANLVLSVGRLAGGLLGVTTNAAGAVRSLSLLNGLKLVGPMIALEGLSRRLQFNKKQADDLVGRTTGGKSGKEALAAVREQLRIQEKIKRKGISQDIGPIHLFSSNEARKAADAIDQLKKKEKELIQQVKDDTAAAKADRGIGDVFASNFKSAASFVQAFGNEVDITKIKVKDFFNQQVEDAKGWAADIEFLTTKKIDPAFLKELVEAGPGGAAMIKAVRGEIEAGNLDFVNNSIRELDRLKAHVAAVSNEAIERINNANPVLKVKLEMEKLNTEAIFGGGGGLSVFGQMKAEFGAKRTTSRGWGAGGGWRGPRREHGGLVSAGKTYLVGERRAELFTPTQSGRIIPRVPNSATTGGNTYNKNIVVNARTSVTEQEIADEVSWKLRER